MGAASGGRNLASNKKVRWIDYVPAVVLVLSSIAVSLYALNLFYVKRVLWRLGISKVEIGNDFHEAVASGVEIFLRWFSLLVEGRLTGLWIVAIACVFFVAVWRMVLRVAMKNKRKCPNKWIAKCAKWSKEVDDKAQGLLTGCLVGGWLLCVAFIMMVSVLLLFVPFWGIAYPVADNELDARGVPYPSKGTLLVSKLIAPKVVVVEGGGVYVGDVLLSGRQAYLMVMCGNSPVTAINAQQVKSITPLGGGDAKECKDFFPHN